MWWKCGERVEKLRNLLLVLTVRKIEKRKQKLQNQVSTPSLLFLSCSSYVGTDYSDDYDYIESKKDDKKNERDKNGEMSGRNDEGSKEDIRMSILKKVFKMKKNIR